MNTWFNEKKRSERRKHYTASRLRLNASKTQVMWLGSRHNLDRVTVSEVQVLTSTVRVVTSARDLGVVIDSRLTTADYVASVCRSDYYHLRQIRPTVQSLTPGGSKALVQAFISGRHLKYCILYNQKCLVGLLVKCAKFRTKEYKLGPQSCWGLLFVSTVMLSFHNVIGQPVF